MALTVEVVCPPEARTVRLAEGATLGEAVAASGFPHQGRKTGIFGKLAGLDAALSEGDRVEIYRPLALDPKEARRRRAAAARGKRTV